jgi:hypothetical protein
MLGVNPGGTSVNACSTASNSAEDLYRQLQQARLAEAGQQVAGTAVTSTSATLGYIPRYLDNTVFRNIVCSQARLNNLFLSSKAYI